MMSYPTVAGLIEIKLGAIGNPIAIVATHVGRNFENRTVEIVDVGEREIEKNRRKGVNGLIVVGVAGLGFDVDFVGITVVIP